MGVGESGAKFCQPIDVGRDSLLVATSVADPVVEIVDSDEEYVGLCCLSVQV